MTGRVSGNLVVLCLILPIIRNRRNFEPSQKKLNFSYHRKQRIRRIGEPLRFSLVWFLISSEVLGGKSRKPAFVDCLISRIIRFECKKPHKVFIPIVGLIPHIIGSLKCNYLPPNPPFGLNPHIIGR